jgi:glucose/arabinose dehydrogenase
VTLVAGDLDRPTAAVAGPDGTIYVADTGAGVVRAIGAGGEVETAIGTGFSGLVSVEGDATDEADLSMPAGLLVVGYDLYVTDVGAHQVLQWKDGLRP